MLQDLLWHCGGQLTHYTDDIPGYRIHRYTPATRKPEISYQHDEDDRDPYLAPFGILSAIIERNDNNLDLELKLPKQNLATIYNATLIRGTDIPGFTLEINNHRIATHADLFSAIIHVLMREA